MRVAQLKTNVQVEEREKYIKKGGGVGERRGERSAGGEQSVGIGRRGRLCTDCAPWMHKAAITHARQLITDFCGS